jgi:hypothetical protein
MDIRYLPIRMTRQGSGARVVRGALAFALAMAAPAAAPAEPRLVAPTAFESFVADPAVIVDLEQWVGTLDSRDAKVSVTVIVAYDSAETTRRMGGVRLTMEDNGGSDSVYVEESKLAALRRDLSDVAAQRPSLKSNDLDAVWRVAGTESCWMPRQPQRILCPSYRIGPEGSGLMLAAYGGATFVFPDRQPAELTALIDRAAATLAAAQTSDAP